ncbi:alpha/beta fold hydrolase [Dactylosporangium sp. CA-092794]|uniref:alpha/beta fold hydrolase n=1 Tax=Dactylosporangium sp. CA-092794 TaxID=3239929 RepID=UPI003D922F39
MNTTVTHTERGTGRAILLLHGGAGPQSVTGFAERLAAELPARVITPAHPGFDGTPRPETVATVADLAAVYDAFLDDLDLHDVTVIGNSIGGWIAAELALRGSARIGRVVLVDAVGIEVPGHPVADFFNLTFPQIAQASYYEPERYLINPDTMSEQARAVMAGNRAALAVYAGGPAMADPTLQPRLKGLTYPALVVWGDSDRIVDPDFGRAYAEAIPGARFVLLERTGHLPQIESPQALLAALRAFTS